MATFHTRTGTLVTLSNENRTAQRNHPIQEFNNGVVLTVEPLKDNQLFEIRIEKKVNSWSGSVEIGVTTCDPNNLRIPTSATGFREGTWVMSGCSILKDGHTVIEEYGQDLDQLNENDKVGVLRTSSGALHFYVNGIDQGPAATNIPTTVYGVVDMYGKCAQVCVVDDANRDLAICNDITNEAIAEASQTNSNERLVLHERCGTLVKLSNGRRTGERRRPLDEFNNGVVMTNRPLRNDELFEIRLDRLVDKWSGSIEVGITTHNPNVLEFPATMTNMRSGTIMMSGCGILTNGKGTRREYGDYNLDQLQEGDRISLVRKSNGCLHYYINAIDQGIAATRTPQTIWGVVDLYGMAVKVTIIDQSEQNCPGSRREPVNTQPNNYLLRFSDMNEDEDDSSIQEPERLLFYPYCGNHAAVMPGQRTAHRPNAVDDFNNGVVLTNRMLLPNELFEVRLDRIIDKWAGSIEIGVTSHAPQELDFPSTMTNIRTNTWMMTGNGVMHNGTTVIDDYGHNLDRLKEGDRVSVLRKSDGTLHFFVNNVDQGQAATNVPASVYGVIDLYGQAAQATIIDQSADPASVLELDISLESNSEELRFHNMHGHNATISTNGKTASRPNARGEFNDAIVISNRCLKDNEVFEVQIDKMVDRWSGSIEAGVTSILPEDIDFPNTMTDIDYDTWMLSGSAIMQDGATVRNGYRLDLDSLVVGSHIGMMRASDGTLHFYLNGEDQGVACTDIPTGVYAVIDLYGQCAEVTLTSGSGVRRRENNIGSTQNMTNAAIATAVTETDHQFSQCCGKNIGLRNRTRTAARARGFNHGLLFSADPLRADELFEVRIDSLCPHWAGSLQIGMTAMAISDNLPTSILPDSAVDLRSKVTWVVCGSEVRKNGEVIKENYAASLDRLEVSDRVGIKRQSDGAMRVYINGEDMGVAATNLPKNTFGLVDLYGVVEQVTITSSRFSDVSSRQFSNPQTETSVSIEEDQDRDTAEACSLQFHPTHGRNVVLTQNGQTAQRTASYNQAVIFSHLPLPRNQLMQVRIEKLNPRWTSSITIGVAGFLPRKISLPQSAMFIKQPCWLVNAGAVFQSGVKVKEQYGTNLDTLQVGHTVGVLVDSDNVLRLNINGVDQGPAARDIPASCYLVLDLYGQCEQVTLLTGDTVANTPLMEHREKADSEVAGGAKEKKVDSTTNNIPAVKNCEYLNLCNRFKLTLGLPEGYFSPESNRCYCDMCHKVRGDEPYFKSGDPPKDHGLPFGWCKFGLRVPAKAESAQIQEKWHTSYHGTQVDLIRRILDGGDLLKQGELVTMGSSLLSQQVTCDEKNKPEEQADVTQILLTPSVRYLSHRHISPKYEYKDPKTKKIHFARAAFQVSVKPGSYKISPQSVGVNEQIDPLFNNNELEWSTKEHGSTVLSDLLVKIE